MNFDCNKMIKIISSNKIEIPFYLIHNGIITFVNKYKPKESIYCIIPSNPMICFIIDSVQKSIYDNKFRINLREHSNPNHWLVLDESSEFYVYDKNIAEKKIEYLKLLG